MSPGTRTSVYVLSDSLGETADAVARAALTQFKRSAFRVVRLAKISSRGQLQGVVRAACAERCAILYTFAAPHLRTEMARLSQESGVAALDILGAAVDTLRRASGIEPSWVVGLTHLADQGYYERVEALDFAVKHDDGRDPEGLSSAEMVLIGVSRSSKTPLAMYLAFKGYRVANIPLVPDVPPPPELFEVDPRRVFGLMTTPDILVEVRTQRAADLGPYAKSYIDRESIEQELDEARALMRHIGCIVVSTEARAIEETAQEILRYYATAFGGTEAAEAQPGGNVAVAAPRTRRVRRSQTHPGD